MGFFSRLFQPRTDGRPVRDDWTSLPEDSQASELVLLGDEAAKLMAEVDIDAAIAGQERWMPWLEQVLLHGVRDARLRPEAIRDDTRSELGQWLHGPGRIALGHLPAFDMMARRHRYFHQQAADVVQYAEAGDERQAQQAYKRCRHASRQVVMLLQELKRGLARGARVGGFAGAGTGAGSTGPDVGAAAGGGGGAGTDTGTGAVPVARRG